MRYTLLITTVMSVLSFSAFAEDMMDRPIRDYPQNTYDASPRAAMMPVARNGEVINSLGSGAIAPVINMEESQNGITYLTGGVGDEELSVLKSKENEFNTRLLLSSAKGEYMGNVSLRFTNNEGVVALNIDGAGPYFYTNLPSGKYTVEAVSSQGVVRTSKVDVPAKAGTKPRSIIF